jgi:hypothetical protein
LTWHFRFVKWEIPGTPDVPDGLADAAAATRNKKQHPQPEYSLLRVFDTQAARARPDMEKQTGREGTM